MNYYCTGSFQLICLAIGALGSCWVIYSTKMPSNPFSKFVKLLMLTNLGLAVFSFVMIVGSSFLTPNSLILSFIAFVISSLVRLFYLISLTISWIPYYIVCNSGTFKSIRWKIILGVIIFISLLLFIIPAWFTDISSLQAVAVADSFLLILAVNLMIYFNIQTWRELRSQRIDRMSNLSGPTFHTNEVFKHTAANMMKKFSGIFAIIEILIWIPTIIYQLIYAYHLTDLEKLNLPYGMVLLYNISQGLFAMNGFFHAWGISYSLKKWTPKIKPKVILPKSDPQSIHSQHHGQNHQQVMIHENSHIQSMKAELSDLIDFEASLVQPPVIVKVV
ncbi:hypothetical protein BC833DRAFT_582509 [Globomyces pollinis-pini]|nr:hypothetical protein BC833DRAFT_582509 [Globomyces pollinis-pini]